MARIKQYGLPVLSMVLLLLLLSCTGAGAEQETEWLIIGGGSPDEAQNIENGDDLTEQGRTRDEVLQYMGSMAAPGFSLVALDGTQVALSDFYGKYVLVNFWTTSSRESLAEMGLFEQMTRQYDEDDLVVLAINSLPMELGRTSISAENQQELEAWTKNFMKDNRYTFRVLFDTDGSVSMLHAYASPAIPVTYFIDREGILRIPWEGPLSAQTAQTLLDMMFALDR